MKNTSSIILLLLLCLEAKAQTMYVRPLTGIQTSYAVTNIKKLTFSNGNLLVNYSAGSNGIFALADNRYINFTDLTLGIDSQTVDRNSFYVYPNPTTNVLNVANNDVSQTLSRLEIISLDGRLLMEQNTSQIMVASLPQGLYFCKITSNNKTQTIKFLKQ
ncbi:MAG: T9SS type A sorting domain-containing protein [Flavobacterium sp.]|nr:T9SS type A sorting domain-containing protein [Flavobacterium sp.]